MAWNGMTDTLTNNLAGELLDESFSGGPLNGLNVTNSYDQYLRRTNLTANATAGILVQAVYGYDGASRLQTVNGGNNDTATYSYLANSSLVGQISYANNGATRMTTSKQYDFLNRMTQISSLPGAAGLAPSAYVYAYNAANQRTQDTLADGSHWNYAYDSLGQLTNGVRSWNDGTPVAGEQFKYQFDAIGNRTQTLTGGDTNGLNLRMANYYVNSLNQITNRDVPGTNDVVGAALVGTNVYVNGVLAADRKWEYYHSTVGTNNAGGAAWLNVVVTNAVNSVTGHIYVAQEPEQFKYDADGNLTNDGRWTYFWDAENRLTRMTNNTGVGPLYNLSFAYDAKGRRIQKIVATNGVAFTTNTFLYDDWNLIAELGANGTPVRYYTWGTDLSGSAQGAGGVGGLLAIGYHGTATTNAFVAYDGNGNVTALINAGDGTLLANYDYGPFGEVIRATGPARGTNPFRFSSKYQDDESDLLYYGHRYYKPSTGTWLNRDPLEEEGGINLYTFVQNDSVSYTDMLGCLSFRFHVVDGYWSGFSGTWSQPFWAGDGDYDIWADGATSSISLNNIPQYWTPADYCNTVNAGFSKAAHAGEIDVYAKDTCGGEFNISGVYMATVWGSGPSGGYGSAFLYTGAGAIDSTVSSSNIHAMPKSPSATAIIFIDEDVTLNPNVEKIVARYVPYLDLPAGKPTEAHATGSFMGMSAAPIGGGMGGGGW